MKNFQDLSNNVKSIDEFNQGNSIATTIVGKSMPRSGHLFFVQLLEACLEPRFFYCEFYTNKECCKSQPRTNGYPGILFLQKSHDLQLTDNAPDQISKRCKFLIQYRHPIPRLFSDWDLMLTIRKSMIDNYESFISFAKKRQEYYISFYKKRILPFINDERFFIVTYESLTGEPVQCVQRFLRFAINDDFQITREHLIRANMTVKFKTNLRSHKYYNVDFLQDYQVSILEQLQGCLIYLGSSEVKV